MALYFLSDVHLRLDRPERSERLARFAAGLQPIDRVVVVGDLCDFWFASRQSETAHSPSPGLQGLANFRDSGGELTLLPGNHDAWIGDYYEKTLGVGYASEHLDLSWGGVRFHATHGHMVGAHSPWKRWMKGERFLRAFRATPSPIASVMNVLLDSANEIHRESVDLKHISVYRHHADSIAQSADVCVYGHIHRTVDEVRPAPRLVVLGGWHRRSSYFRVEDDGSANLIVIEDEKNRPPGGGKLPGRP